MKPHNSRAGMRCDIASRPKGASETAYGQAVHAR